MFIIAFGYADVIKSIEIINNTTMRYIVVLEGSNVPARNITTSQNNETDFLYPINSNTYNLANNNDIRMTDCRPFRGLKNEGQCSERAKVCGNKYNLPMSWNGVGCTEIDLTSGKTIRKRDGGCMFYYLLFILS
jgi:hypothetical protein